MGDQDEVGHIGGIFSDREAVRGIGRDHSAVFRPVDEIVTNTRRGRDGACRTDVVLTTACHRTTSTRTGRDGDGVVVGNEVSDIGARLGHSEGVACAGAHHSAVLCPVGKEVICGRRSNQGAALAVVVSASTTHRTALARVGRSCDGVAVELEVGNVGSVFVYGDVVIGRGGDYGAILRPVHKGIACRGSSRQSADGAIVIHTAARDGTTYARVGRG